MAVGETRLTEYCDRFSSGLNTVRMRIEKQQALAVACQQAMVFFIVINATYPCTFSAGGVDGRNRLLSCVKARRPQCEIGNLTSGVAVFIKLMNGYAVRAALADKQTIMSAIQRSDVVSILAGCRRPTADDPAYEGGIVPEIFRA